MPQSRPRRVSPSAAARLAAVLVCGAGTAYADQVGTEWHEQPSFTDAGQLPGTAQETLGHGAMTAIRGTVSNADADVFRVFISDFSLFSATTVGTGTTADTQLFLFTNSGIGIACNDDAPVGGPRSTLPLGSSLYAGFSPGVYLLAISRFDYDPVSSGGDVFPDSPVTSVLGPTGPGGANALSGWSGPVAGGLNSSYTIALTGVEFVPLPTAAWAGLGGLGVAMGLAGFRRRRLR